MGKEAVKETPEALIERERLLDILDQLAEDRERVKESTEDPSKREALVAYIDRMTRLVSGEEVAPLSFSKRKRCGAVPGGMYCRLDLGHVMPHNPDDGPWPPKKWSAEELS